MPDATDRAFALGLEIIRLADDDPGLSDILDHLPVDSIGGYDCPVCGWSELVTSSREAFVGAHLLKHEPVRTRVKRRIESEKAALERRIEREKGASRRRSRTLPDVASAYPAAVRGLRRDGTRLTWSNIATRMADDAGLESLDERTLRGWVNKDGLPRPEDITDAK